VASVWGYSQFHRLSLALSTSTFLPKLLITPSGGGVHIKFLRIEKTDRGSCAEFRVMNGGSDALRYSGYSKDDHCSYMIRRGDKVEQKTVCWCGNGLEEHMLSPGESATYKVPVTHESGEFEVGFDFWVSKKSRKRTIRSNEQISVTQ
jgi:hypothetical protein